MKRDQYKAYKWYPIIENTYWIETLTEEFPQCRTIVRHNIKNSIELYTITDSYLTWETMIKEGNWAFMIIDLR